MKKKIFSFIIISIIVTEGFFIGKFFWDIHTTSDKNQLIISINDGNIFDEDGLVYAPGETRTSPLIIKNNGFHDVYYKIYLDNVRGELKDSIIFKIYLDDKLMHCVLASEFNKSHPFISNKPIKVKETHTYVLEIEIMCDIGNEFQNQILNFDIVAYVKDVNIED